MLAAPHVDEAVRLPRRGSGHARVSPGAVRSQPACLSFSPTMTLCTAAAMKRDAEYEGRA